MAKSIQTTDQNCDHMAFPAPVQGTCKVVFPGTQRYFEII